MTFTNYRVCKLASAVLAGIVGYLVFSSGRVEAQTAYYASGYQAAAMQRQAYPAYGRPVAAPVAYQQRPQAMPVAPVAVSNYLNFNGVYASAPSHLPAPVQYAVAAGNQLQGKPYARGGGHRNVNDYAYDCSGSVSYTLIKAGLLNRPLSSKEFSQFGAPGPGQFITIYIKPGEHVFMSICGLRLDTTGGGEGQGPRWRPTARSTNGFIVRHPFGL